MGLRQCDIAILGGGLAGGLVALAFARARPDLSLLLVEQAETLGGNHVWSFFGSDAGRAARDLLAPLVEHGWKGYSVRFPDYDRDLPTSYYSMSSRRLDAVLRAELPADAILCNSRALACTATGATLADGTRIEAGAVIDARGIRNASDLTGGWQKFVGRRLRLSQPHGLAKPIVMDARVEQVDGFRFVYCLPFADDEIFIEDTYYSDSPYLDPAVIGHRIDTYAAAQGFKVEEVLDQETGVLPVVAGGSFSAYWRASGTDAARAGARAALFHPLTSYSVPEAARFAIALAQCEAVDGETLARFSEGWAQSHWRRTKFYRALSAMLFAAALPGERYRILQRFYRLPFRLIERFYASRSTAADKVRILIGRPPVSLSRAIGVLAGFGARPRSLHQPPPVSAGQLP